MRDIPRTRNSVVCVVRGRAPARLGLGGDGRRLCEAVVFLAGGSANILAIDVAEHFEGIADRLAEHR